MSPAYAVDGLTTYCWALNASEDSASVLAQGQGLECPLSLQLTPAKTSFNVNDSIPLVWTVSTAETNNSAFNVTSDKASVSIESSTVEACEGDACNPFASSSSSSGSTSSTSNQSGTLSLTQGSVTRFTSSKLKFASAAQYTLMAHVVIAGQGPTRYDFIVLTSVTVESETSVGSNGNESPSESSIGSLSVTQFLVMCGALVFLMVCVAVTLVLIVRRRRIQRLKSEQTTETSPERGSDHRFSDWSELYATNDTLPNSIMIDDSSTIAILRASRASSPSSTPRSFSRHRTVADFTRDIALWDMRASASPITPGTDSFLCAIQDANRSPVDGFVPLETMLARPRPPRSTLSDSEDESEVDV